MDMDEHHFIFLSRGYVFTFLFFTGLQNYNTYINTFVKTKEHATTSSAYVRPPGARRFQAAVLRLSKACGFKRPCKTLAGLCPMELGTFKRTGGPYTRAVVQQ